MRRSLPIWLTLFVVTGCGTTRNSSPQLAAEYTPDKKADVCKAPYEATYVLRHWPKSEKTTRSGKPLEEPVDLFERNLNKRDQLGFERSADGALVAVAADERIRLEPGRYTWEITKYTGMKQFAHETNERTAEMARKAVETAALPFVFVFFWIFQPSFC